MASKYSAARKRIPEQRTERDQVMTTRIAQLRDVPIHDLFKLFNANKDKLEALSKQVKSAEHERDSISVVIREKIDGLNVDTITAEGFTWGHKPTPLPVCENPDEIIKYFKDHDMGDQLELSKSELAERLRSFVNSEVENNEFRVVEEQEIDPATGEERTVTVVRSQIPGVKIFMKPGLSRTKASAKLKGDSSE